MNHPLNVIFMFYSYLFLESLFYRNKTGCERITFDNGVVLHRSQVEVLLGSRWLSSLDRLSSIFSNMDLDISAFGCLCALSLVAGKFLLGFCWIIFNFSLKNRPPGCSKPYSSRTDGEQGHFFPKRSLYL